MEINEILVLAMFGTFIALLFTGFPVAWVLGGTGVLFAGVGYLTDQYLDTMTGLDYSTLGLAVGRIFGVMENWVLVALPMFIFMGLMLERSGVAERMMNAMQQLFGRVRGGLAITVTLIGIVLAASTGIIGASVVLLGLMSVPVMLRQGYHRPLALGTVAAAGCLGILIPPSIMLVIMGDQLRLSVGDLFMGAVFPGLILGLLYMGYILIYGRLRPDHAPLGYRPNEPGWSLLGRMLWTIIPPAGLILAVLGSIFAGIATVIEASGIGALGATLLAVLYRKLDFAVLREVVLNTFNTSAYIFAIFIGATVFSLVLRELGGDELIESALASLALHDYALLALVLGVIFILGFFLDWIEITLVILPLLKPVISALDIPIDGHGVVEEPLLLWFALLVAVTLQTSFLTPPVGFALFYLRGVSPPDVKLAEIYRGVVPFILLQLIGLLLLVLFPSVVTWLPAVAYR
ncbi:MAG: TRAP transporter large permease subunit [Chromatiales bacterium]|nr:TRAP transporter large permease subunit [Chromatiales bacterium]